MIPMTRILASVLLALTPLEQAADLVFTRIQEDWVIDHYPGPAETYLAPRDARLLRRLGCPRYECREDAAEELASRGRDAARLLVIGMRHRDIAVRTRARRLWDRLFVCPVCAGTGLAGDGHPGVSRPVGGWQGEYEILVCPECWGSRDSRARIESTWIDRAWLGRVEVLEWRERDLFPRAKERRR
jgi:hypothetical protein